MGLARRSPMMYLTRLVQPVASGGWEVALEGEWLQQSGH